MSRSRMIRVEDAARLLRLAGELTEVKGDLSTRGGHLINRLCELLDAQVGVIAVIAPNPRKGPPVFLSGTEAGFLDETSQRLLRKYVQEVSVYSQDPLMTPINPLAEAPYTISRQRSVPDREWYESPFVNEVKFRMKIDDAIYSDHPIPGRGISVGYGINRRKGDKPFGDREHNLMQLLNENLGWFFRQLAEDAKPDRPPLAPSLRRVLAELLRGCSEKQIARTLRLSPHTVHEHIKKLYRHFDVTSRPELMARFIP